jgi:hypothetical protein
VSGRGSSLLALALVGLAGSACGRADEAAARDTDAGAPVTDSAVAPVADAGAPPPTNVAGRWGMRQLYSDSIAAELIQTGDVLTGTACSTGLSTDPIDRLYCGPLQGRVDGRRVRFSAALPTAHLDVDAYAPKDGSRIAGPYSVDGNDQLTAWSRLADGASWFDPEENWPADLLPWSCNDPAYNPGYRLTLVDDPTGSDAYTSDRTYLVVFCAGIAGDLGAFGGSDLHVTTVDGHTTAIVAGPVPETSPTLPTGLTLRFENSLLVGVEARTPSGATYGFRADRSLGGTH